MVLKSVVPRRMVLERMAAVPVTRPFVAALVPAKDRGDSIADTVDALLAVPRIDQVVVIDDGSVDDTSAKAVGLSSGADGRLLAIRLPRNLGKGGAIDEGVRQTPNADIYLLIDADLGHTARVADALLEPVMTDKADLVIGVPTTAAGVRGGFGRVKQLAGEGIRSACGFEARAPLSGQRAIRASLLRQIDLADRFGLETAMTIDVVRASARVLEVPIEFDHRHTGRSLAGFMHRGTQGADIVRALWSRRTTAPTRIGLMLFGAMLFLAMALVRSGSFVPSSQEPTRQVDRVVLFGFPRLSLADLGSGNTPNLDRMIDEGAVGATSVRTVSGRPSTVEAYTTLGAGGRVRAGDVAADAFRPDAKVGLLTAKESAELRTGKRADGGVIVTGLAETISLNEHRYLPTLPGAFGEALRLAGKTTAVVGNSDLGLVEVDSTTSIQRPAAVALADLSGSVGFGTVDGLLVADATRPFGVRVDANRLLRATKLATRSAKVTVIDPGEMDRLYAYKANVSDAQFEHLRGAALRRTDALVERVRQSLPSGTLMMVVGMRPPTIRWELTPTVAWGAGVRHGYLHSSSTNRRGLITLTDLAPTILSSLGVDPARNEASSAMIGHPLSYVVGGRAGNVEFLRDMNDLAGYRERIYLPLTKGYVIFQIIVYLLTILLFSSRGSVGVLQPAIERVVLGVAAWPLTTFLFRLIPSAWKLGPFGPLVMIGICSLVVMLARRAHRHALSPLAWILFATVAINVIDLCSGAALQQSSILGYSPHTAARFTGIGNAAFAALASTCVLWCAIHVQYAPRRREALWAAGLVCAVVLIADGAPFLGSDVGGILTLVPVFGLLLYSLTGRRVRLRTVGLAGLVTAAMLGVAALVDYSRAPDSRTHLGRLVASVLGKGDGTDTFLTTVARKLQTNVRVFTGSFWTWIVPLIAVVLLFFLVVQRGWERDMGRGSALRAGIVAALLCGLLGFAVNDSGTVVTALVFVYMGPFITLLALHRDDFPKVITR